MRVQFAPRVPPFWCPSEVNDLTSEQVLANGIPHHITPRIPIAVCARKYLGRTVPVVVATELIFHANHRESLVLQSVGVCR